MTRESLHQRIADILRRSGVEDAERLIRAMEQLPRRCAFSMPVPIQSRNYDFTGIFLNVRCWLLDGHPEDCAPKWSEFWGDPPTPTLPPGGHKGGVCECAPCSAFRAEATAWKASERIDRALAGNQIGPVSDPPAK